MAEPFIGQIMMAGFNFAPRGWALCNGQLMSIAQNTALFSLLGTYYGGDGRVTFALPNLQGRATVHQGQGPGLSPYVIGEESGEQNVTLISTEMPMHTHGANAVSGAGDKPSPIGNFWAGEAGGITFTYATGPANTTMNVMAIGLAGGSQPHNNQQPFLGLTFVIALEGIFPSRN